MTNTEIVKKLIGNIQPSGESHLDNERFENLKAMCELAADIIYEIRQVAKNKDRQEYSMKTMGKFAQTFLNNNMP